MSFFNITAEANAPQFAGRQASAKVFFGEFSRFALFAVHTRFESVQWFVADGESLDKAGLARIVRQAATPEQAVAGLQ